MASIKFVFAAKSSFIQKGVLALMFFTTACNFFCPKKRKNSLL